MCEEYEVVAPETPGRIEQGGEPVYCPYVRGQCQPNCVMNFDGKCLQAEALKAVGTPPCLSSERKGAVFLGGRPEDMPPGLMRMIEAITKEMEKHSRDDDDYQE